MKNLIIYDGEPQKVVCRQNRQFFMYVKMGTLTL